MPNEMNHAEVADRLEKEATRRKELYQAAHMVDDNYDFIATLHIAASDERRIANGELVPVVHGNWTKKYDSGSQNYNSDENWYYVCSKCGGWDKTPKKYCHCCGALMDEERKDGGEK
jgi:hypothetical protein